MARKKAKAYPESFRKEAVRLANMPDRTAVDVFRPINKPFSKLIFKFTGISQPTEEK